LLKASDTIPAGFIWSKSLRPFDEDRGFLRRYFDLWLEV
jgi:hypothetical protein